MRIAGRLRRSYDDAENQKILGENLLRIWEPGVARAARLAQ